MKLRKHLDIIHPEVKAKALEIDKLPRKSTCAKKDRV